MSLQHVWQSIFTRIEHFNFYQITVFVAVILAIGFVSLRGFGSRSNY